MTTKNISSQRSEIRRQYKEWLKVANTVSEKKADALLLVVSEYAKSVGQDSYLDSLIIENLQSIK
jgi:hypothetical protein